MLRLKRSSLFYFLWIAGILAIVTTFFYLPHLRDPRDHNLVLNDIKLSNEIQSRLTQLESGLKDNRVVLDELREKIEKLYSESLYTNPLELRDSGTCANVPGILCFLYSSFYALENFPILIDYLHSLIHRTGNI